MGYKVAEVLEQPLPAFYQLLKMSGYVEKLKWQPISHMLGGADKKVNHTDLKNSDFAKLGLGKTPRRPRG
jgi:hypothetical protein